MFCVPGIVICGCVMLTGKMDIFQINVLFQIFLSSTFSEHHVFMIRKTILYMQFFVVRFSCVYVNRLAGGRKYWI